MKSYISYIVIVLLGIVVTGEVVYIAINHNLKTKDNITDNYNNEDKENSNNSNKDNTSDNSSLNDSVKLLSTKKENNNVIQEYEIILNGKKNDLKVTFQITEEEITGKFNDTSFYSNILFDNDEDIKAFGTNYVKNKFNEKNFKIIKGEDNKNYLVVTSFYENPTGVGSSLIIYNDNLLKIGELERTLGGQSLILENDKDVWYKDEFDNYGDEFAQIKAKIENNKIYNLYFDFKEDYYLNVDDEGYGDYGTLEEREYMISNDKLDYKVLNKYKVVNVAGAI